MTEIYDKIEKMLEDSEYVAGDALSIADFSFVACVTAWSIYVPCDETEHPKIACWLKRMEQLPYYEEASIPGLNMYKDYLKDKL